MVAQVNLILNPSFEDTIKCVTINSRFQGYVSDWRGGDGDYFSEHCQGFQVEVPNNGLGYQYPHSGVAYTGIYTAILDNVPSHQEARDYIEGQLDTNLVRGERYYIGAYVSLAEINQYVTPIQFKFTSDTLTYNQYLIPMSASVEGTDLVMLSDTVNWIWVGGFYRAHGLETHLVMGNFLYDSLTPLNTFNPAAAQPTCYYYIDDVAVYRVADARAGNDVEICLGDSIVIGDLVQPGIKYTWLNSPGLSDTTAGRPIVHPTQTTTYVLAIQDTTGYYFPGVLTDSITVFVDSCKVLPPPIDWFVPTVLNGSDHFISGSYPADLSFSLYDTRGRLVYAESSFTNTVVAGQFSAGGYIVVITENDGSVVRKKILIGN